MYSILTLCNREFVYKVNTRLNYLFNQWVLLNDYLTHIYIEQNMSVIISTVNWTCASTEHPNKCKWHKSISYLTYQMYWMSPELTQWTEFQLNDQMYQTDQMYCISHKLPWALIRLKWSVRLSGFCWTNIRCHFVRKNYNTRQGPTVSYFFLIKSDVLW